MEAVVSFSTKTTISNKSLYDLQTAMTLNTLQIPATLPRPFRSESPDQHNQVVWQDLESLYRDGV